MCPCMSTEIFRGIYVTCEDWEDMGDMSSKKFEENRIDYAIQQLLIWRALIQLALHE